MSAIVIFLKKREILGPGAEGDLGIDNQGDVKNISVPIMASRDAKFTNISSKSKTTQKLEKRNVLSFSNRKLFG